MLPAKFHPTNNNLFLCASSDNRLYGWDCRAGTVTQEYNYHLAPANTVTFFDEGRKFVSTSDDKKILVWEFDIPVPIKYIQVREIAYGWYCSRVTMFAAVARSLIAVGARPAQHAECDAASVGRVLLWPEHGQHHRDLQLLAR
jgi:WD40 repeat protein